jgi:heptosyltransferase-2
VENWIELFSNNSRFSRVRDEILKNLPLIIVSGEADKEQTAQLEHAWKDRDIRFAKDLTLPHLAAVLEHTIFMGHDSGISHLAAATGATCILLFGPTDPNIWAPTNENVCVLRAQSGNIRDLEIESVEAAVATAVSSGRPDP